MASALQGREGSVRDGPRQLVPHWSRLLLALILNSGTRRYDSPEAGLEPDFLDAVLCEGARETPVGDLVVRVDRALVVAQRSRDVGSLLEDRVRSPGRVEQMNGRSQPDISSRVASDLTSR